MAVDNYKCSHGLYYIFNTIGFKYLKYFKKFLIVKTSKEYRVKDKLSISFKYHLL